MVDFERFQERDAAIIAGWAGDTHASMMWCSLPSVSADIVSSWSSSATVLAWVMRDNDRTLGYGEIWIDHEENEVELARLIVDPESRGRGYGTQLASGLAEIGRRHFPLVSLRVHPQNDVAIRSYAAAAFQRVEAAQEAAWNIGQPVEYVWMTHAGDHEGTDG